ncbi:FAD-dependent tricarballylate dehydrogenase TcuA [Paeniglutamicibacter terrestris]|uniref:FAD-dependent tricarballylate dehydrogenase TcuA n=1 Tax=Paeniglutamicibacter terrestris TaxID=2723403 RepID=A0ABX1G1C6_9MICC|nr:FAD-dependent tricarballylate dehydrogenase TcuA [Paeniglutamicibacter terrestris]ASN37789.1 tricarballylate dehydrogenase [Arthrobacter sp. 7749]NKG20020.1 FAD-dependent tricarballylate dehydrogenase TcuA [Paeniglutamicibacter terrestris]
MGSTATEVGAANVADVIVVGGGNAAFTAAHAATERGRKVLLLEKAPRELFGGNSYYTAGATRIAHNGIEDLSDFIEADERHAVSEVPPYSAADYAADLKKVTEGRNDPELTEVLVNEAAPGLRWLQGLGLKYRLMYERQAYEREDGTFLFWGGLHVGNVGGGEGLMADHVAVAEKLGTEVRYGQDVFDIILENGVAKGVKVRGEDGSVQELRAESVILAAGGFESNPEMRREHLGEGWQNAKIRGTAFNHGEMITAGLAAGAVKGGDWGTCHSVQWDAFTAKNESNRELTNRLTRQSYPLGIIVNNRGERFLDEGADFRNLTYAKYGRVILQQPDSVAYQVFDASLRPLLRAEEYEMPGISEVIADTIEELADKLGVDAAALSKTVSDFNGSIDTSITYDPNVLDGRAAKVSPPKSNWAMPLETGPFYAYPVTCGITFTFGGLKSDTHGRVLNENGEHIDGLYVCGEMLGGLFSANYPGGSGLAAGVVFGRRAGTLA